MVGDILRREREKQGLTIADVAEETSIREIYLEAIEKGDYDQLPGDVYTKGFIRNYSKFLQIDGNNLLEQFASERNIVKTVQPVDMLHEEKQSISADNASSGYSSKKQSKTNLFASGDEYRQRLEREKKSGSRKFMILLGVMLVFLGGVYIAFMDDGTSETAKQTAQTQTAKNKEQQKPVAAVPDKKYDGVNISAKFLENCWVSVKADGQQVYEGTVAKGKTMEWQGKTAVEILAGNAGGIEITMNGQSQGAMGAIGQVAERSYTAQNGGAAATGTENKAGDGAAAASQPVNQANAAQSYAEPQANGDYGSTAAAPAAEVSGTNAAANQQPAAANKKAN